MTRRNVRNMLFKQIWSSSNMWPFLIRTYSSWSSWITRAHHRLNHIWFFPFSESILPLHHGNVSLIGAIWHCSKCAHTMRAEKENMHLLGLQTWLVSQMDAIISPQFTEAAFSCLWDCEWGACLPFDLLLYCSNKLLPPDGTQALQTLSSWSVH